MFTFALEVRDFSWTCVMSTSPRRQRVARWLLPYFSNFYNILGVNKSESTEQRRWWKEKSPAPELSSFYIDWKFSILQFPKFSFLFFVQHRVQKLWPLKAKCVERGERKLYFSEQPKTFPHFLSSSLAIRDLREKLEAFRFNFSYCFSPRPFFFRFHSPPPILSIDCRLSLMDQPAVVYMCATEKENEMRKAKSSELRNRKIQFFSSFPFLITSLAIFPRFLLHRQLLTACMCVDIVKSEWSIQSFIPFIPPTYPLRSAAYLDHPDDVRIPFSPSMFYAAA